MRTFPYLLAILIALSAAGSLAGERVYFEDENLVIGGEERLDSDAEYIRDIYPEAKKGIESMLGLNLLSRPTVLLVGNRELFERIAGSPYIAALAVPSEKLILIHISAATSKRYVLNDTFKHELCHLVLHDNIGNVFLPKWLDEGICQWISGSFGEMLAGEGIAISRFDMARRFIPLERLSINFPREREPLSLAYKESLDFVEYLTSHYGAKSLIQILQLLKAGEYIDSAFPKVLSKSFREVQDEWLVNMQKSGEWLVWGSEHLYDILFFVAAVLSILAFFRAKWKRSRYAEMDEDEED